MINKVIDEQQLKAICDVLGETNRGYTKTELTRLLQQSGIELVPDGRKSNGYTYQLGLNKRDWLYNCLANEINRNHSLMRVYIFTSLYNLCKQLHCCLISSFKDFIKVFDFMPVSMFCRKVA